MAFEVSVDEAAVQLDVTPRQVRYLIEQGDLRARKIGATWAVYQSSIDRRKRTKRPYRKKTADAVAVA